MTTLTDLSPALVAVDRVLRENDDRHQGVWRTTSIADHVDHAIRHLAAWIEGDREEDHLGHGATRVLMAIAAEERPS